MCKYLYECCVWHVYRLLTFTAVETQRKALSTTRSLIGRSNLMESCIMPARRQSLALQLLMLSLLLLMDTTVFVVITLDLTIFNYDCCYLHLMTVYPGKPMGYLVTSRVLLQLLFWKRNYYYYYNRFMAPGICPGLPGWAGTRKVKPGRQNQSGFNVAILYSVLVTMLLFTAT